MGEFIGGLGCAIYLAAITNGSKYFDYFEINDIRYANC